MIVDCHHHVFQPWAEGPCGHPSDKLHKQHLQHMSARAVAHAFRVSDGKKLMDASALRAPGTLDWNGLTDVNFRAGTHGQVLFTLDGEDYAIQYLPPTLSKIEATPEMMLAQMRYAGVNHSILHAGGMYGSMTEMNATVQAAHPKMVTGSIWVEEPTAGEPTALSHIEHGARVLGLRAIYFNTETFARFSFNWTLDDPRLDPFWALLNDLELVLIAELSASPGIGAGGFTANLVRLGGVLSRWRNIRCQLAMSVPPQFYAVNGHYDLPDEALAVYRNDRVWVELMYPITWGGRWSYPYREAWPLIRNLRDSLGASSLLWGSDMPMVERFCTYRQSLDYLIDHCDFLIPREIDLIIGGNAIDLFQIKTA